MSFFKSTTKEKEVDKHIGKRLDGRYEIIELIGRGGMANVYRAHDRLEDIDVAVKILREEFLGNEEFVRRFKNESKAISLLSHPNIVKVFDVNFSDKVQCIVMELIDGITLKDYIERQGSLGWKDTVYFTEQILKALQHAHDRGIVHRDIKPQNIMLMSDGLIKVMDFGIARFSRSETRTITDKAIGSVHYISPEQAKGDSTDAKADIYSTGVMMYEMLSGKLPFDSDSAVSVAIKQISDVPDSITRANPSVPEALEEITFKAMAKDPARRYQSASQMLRDIDEFKKNPSIKFEYKYFSDDAPTRYVETTKQVRAASKAPAPKKKFATRVTLTMLGITLAALIGSAILVYLIFNTGDNALFKTVEDVELPNFVGMNIETIKQNPDYKFHFEVVEEFNSDDKIGVGVVYDQTPVPPLMIKKTSTVTLKVSKGPEIRTIPSVRGLKTGEAIKLLQSEGFAVRVDLKPNEGVGPNEAYMTSPDSGEKRRAGEVVTLYINPSSGGGVSTVYVPELVGMSQAEARVVLTQNFLSMGEITEVEDEAPIGTIIGQELIPKMQVEVGTKVNVTVSKGKTEHELGVNYKLPYSVGGKTTYSHYGTLNDNEIYREQITAGPTTASIVVKSSGGGVLKVFVEGQLLYEYHINFDNGTITLAQDHSSSFVMNAPVVVNKANLIAAIATAEAKMAGVKVSPAGDGSEPEILSGESWVSQTAMDGLVNALNAAKNIVAKPNASQAEVDSALSVLNAAIGGFNPQVKP